MRWSGDQGDTVVCAHAGVKYEPDYSVADGSGAVAMDADTDAGANQCPAQACTESDGASWLGSVLCNANCNGVAPHDLWLMCERATCGVK